MLTRETVQEILQPLRDPETGKSLMELQRIRDIVVKERTVRLSVTYSSEDVRASLEAQIREILEAMGQRISISACALWTMPLAEQTGRKITIARS